MYEVELKYPLDDALRLTETLRGLGADFDEPLRQTDRYYAHPCRDFAVTDEALRLRSTGDGVVITWKGPRIGGASKTRREIELPLGLPAAPPEATLGEWDELLRALGFRPVREVTKERLPGVLPWQGGAVAVSIDRVPDLGSFLEIEVLAGESGVAEAEARLRALAETLGCRTPERRSYLELILAREAAPRGGSAGA